MRFYHLFWAFALTALPVYGQSESISILDVPNYEWYAGCFGTATGNLMGFWDRNGFPNFYSGPTGGGLAPLRSTSGNASIYSLWASKAGVDGRPLDKPGHMDDYYGSYESTAPDPYVTAGRAEHEPDCIGDFIGLSQRKWTNLNNECDGNINAYSFVYWDASGQRRVNYTPGTNAGPPVDIQSGLRKWCQWRGYDADVFTQLAEFSPETPPGQGFTWNDLKAEIKQGYPVMIFLQPHGENYRPRGLSGEPPLPKGNPPIHGMLIFGYRDSGGTRLARYRSSWGVGDNFNAYSEWGSGAWEANLPVRGMIGFRPHPKVTRITKEAGQVTLQWDGPSSAVYSEFTATTNYPHVYTVQKSATLNPADFVPVGSPTRERTLTVEDDGQGGFYRVRLDHQ